MEDGLVNDIGPQGMFVRERKTNIAYLGADAAPSRSYPSGLKPYYVTAEELYFCLKQHH